MSEVIEAEKVDSIEWLNVRLSGIVKRTEASALRHQADATDLVAERYEIQANTMLAKIQSDMGLGPEYEGVVQNNKLVFTLKS